jgi:hypothetical protein
VVIGLGYVGLPNHHNPLFIQQFYNSAPQPRNDNSPSD